MVVNRRIVSESLNGQEFFVIEEVNDMCEVKYITDISFVSREEGEQYLAEHYPRKWPFLSTDKRRYFARMVRKAIIDNSPMVSALLHAVYAVDIASYTALVNLAKRRGVVDLEPIKDSAQRLGIPHDTLRRWCRQGLIDEAVKIGKWYFLPKSITKIQRNDDAKHTRA